MTYMLVRNRVADFDKWKLIFDSRGERRQLFHLTSDPTEQNDLSEQHPEILRELTVSLSRFRQTNAALSSLRPTETQRSDETLEQLRALGYVH